MRGPSEVRNRISPRSPNPYVIASVYAWCGDRDGALGWLEKAIAEHDDDLVTLKVDPLFRSIRGDPRYLAMIRKMNFPPD